MKKIYGLFALILSTVLFVSCISARGTALVTGIQRSATDPETVNIYTEIPENYEVIGLVSASSDSGWTEQECLNYAIDELKKQAAKIGANGIILDSINKSTEEYVMIYGVAVPVSAQNVSGKAIYVEK